jgi:hypothetical protein
LVTDLEAEIIQTLPLILAQVVVVQVLLEVKAAMETLLLAVLAEQVLSLDLL